MVTIPNELKLLESDMNLLKQLVKNSNYQEVRVPYHVKDEIIVHKFYDDQSMEIVYRFEQYKPDKNEV